MRPSVPDPSSLRAVIPISISSNHATAGAISKEVPILYGGAGCSTAITGTSQSTDEASHLQFSADGKTLYAVVSGGFQVAEARGDKVTVFDLSDPANPVQKPSITHGVGANHTGDAVSGDGKWFFATDNLSGSVTQVEIATNQVKQTIKTSDPTKYNSLTLSTYGSTEGPSENTGPIP